MALITPTHVYKLLDKLAASYAALAGDSASGFGAGDGTYGVSEKVQDLKEIIESSADATFADADLQAVFIPGVLNLPAAVQTGPMFRDKFSAFISLLDAVCAKAVSVDSTIRDLDTFLAYYNYGNGEDYWQALAPPDWYHAYGAVKNGNYPRQKNTYFEVLEGGEYAGETFANGLGKLDVTGAGTGNTTLGKVIDRTKYAGGFAYMVWTGATGGGDVTVTGKDQDNVAETWIGTLAGAADEVILTPQTREHSLITEVTTIVAAAGVTNGDIVIEARRPAGRTNPPA